MKEETLKEMFEHYGKVEKLNRIRSYSFVFFEERDDCMRVSFLSNLAKQQ